MFSAPPLQAIAAVADNGAIGYQGRLPWHLPEELAWFKKLTLGGILLMGSKTYSSIGRALPGRTTVVLSTQPRPQQLPDAVLWTPNWQETLQAQWVHDKPIWVCGGAAVYAALLPYCHAFVVSHVHQNPPGDAWVQPWVPPFKKSTLLHAQPEFEIVRYTQDQPLPWYG